MRPDETEHTLSAGTLGGLIRVVLRFGRINDDWWPYGKAFTEDTRDGTRWRQRMKRTGTPKEPGQ